MSKKGQNGQEGVDTSKKGMNSRPNGVGASKNSRFRESWGGCIQKRDALRPEVVSESKIRAKRAGWGRCVQNGTCCGQKGSVRPKRDASQARRGRVAAGGGRQVQKRA